MITKLSIINGANIFPQEYFKIIQYLYQLKKYIEQFSRTFQIDSWKSNEMSEETIENITKSDKSFAPMFIDQHLLPDINFDGQCLIKHIYP